MYKATLTAKVFTVYGTSAGRDVCTIYYDSRSPAGLLVVPATGVALAVTPYSIGMIYKNGEYVPDYEIVLAGAVQQYSPQKGIGTLPAGLIHTVLDACTFVDAQSLPVVTMRWLPVAEQVSPEYSYGLDVVEIKVASNTAGIVLTEGVSPTTNNALRISSNIQLYS